MRGSKYKNKSTDIEKCAICTDLHKEIQYLNVNLNLNIGIKGYVVSSLMKRVKINLLLNCVSLKTRLCKTWATDLDK